MVLLNLTQSLTQIEAVLSFLLNLSIGWLASGVLLRAVLSVGAASQYSSKLLCVQAGSREAGACRLGALFKSLQAGLQVEDWESGEMLTIQLDRSMPPSETAATMYRTARKQGRTGEAVAPILEVRNPSTLNKKLYNLFKLHKP